jgi:hypothetical protein
VTSARGGGWSKDGTIVYTSSTMADGTKFLINSGNLKEGSETFTLVQNWPPN